MVTQQEIDNAKRASRIVMKRVNNVPEGILSGFRVYEELHTAYLEDGSPDDTWKLFILSGNRFPKQHYSAQASELFEAYARLTQVLVDAGEITR